MEYAKPYNAAVFIGRFQPLHKAHIKIIDRALVIADKVVIVIGSSFKPRSPENPFTFEERKEMILRSINNSIDRNRIFIEPNGDTIYNNPAWAIRVQKAVAKHTADGDKIALMGDKKTGDKSTFYLDMFPQWEREGAAAHDPAIDATSIRKLYFDPKMNIGYISGVIDRNNFEWLSKFRNKETYKDIVEEIQYIADYHKQWAVCPYPPVFVTVDAVIFQSGNVLLIKRKSKPGKGLWALPGGFLDVKVDKSVEDGMIRELREETGIKVPEPVLRGNIKSTKVFDHPNRSARGRTITHAFNIVLPDNGTLPKVKGADDAEKAVWIPIAELKSEECFEDHAELIQHFVGG